MLRAAVRTVLLQLRAAVAAVFSLTWIGNNTNAMDGTVFTFTAQGIGTADVSRKVVFGVFGRRNTPANVTVTATLAISVRALVCG